MFSKKLKLFQKNENSIWTDEHISKELLKCHLNDFTDGASRKLTKRNKILEFINNSIKKNSNILDLGCGPGLFDFELSKLGHKILGVDIYIASINYAIKYKKSKNIDYRYENYLESIFTEKYDAILMIY
ncbi:MAG: class I SAM-dependent methyltransferase, partial [Clostridia bacterium]|nr:class I SAM-dependent methyltransferase [Clostridia bacterium]